MGVGMVEGVFVVEVRGDLFGRIVVVVVGDRFGVMVEGEGEDVEVVGVDVVVVE